MTDEQRRAWSASVSDELTAYRRGIETMVSYPFAVGPDGSFRVEDVPPGDYQLDIKTSELRTNGTAVVLQPISLFIHEFIVPDLPDGRSDEPLDLGELEIEPAVPQK
ncbi:MAG TPA: hypothetical protein VLZ12_15280 [Verrucomicrobiae bacterium]|nr:hypothetical protein [Verrucomicrobiae bacterium]